MKNTKLNIELCEKLLINYGVTGDLLSKAKEDIMQIKKLSTFSGMMSYRQNLNLNEKTDLNMNDYQKMGLIHFKVLIDVSDDAAIEIANLNLKNKSIEQIEDSVKAIEAKYKYQKQKQ